MLILYSSLNHEPIKEATMKLRVLAPNSFLVNKEDIISPVVKEIKFLIPKLIDESDIMVSNELNTVLEIEELKRDTLRFLKPDHSNEIVLVLVTNPVCFAEEALYSEAQTFSSFNLSTGLPSQKDFQIGAIVFVNNLKLKNFSHNIILVEYIAKLFACMILFYCKTEEKKHENCFANIKSSSINLCPICSSFLTILDKELLIEKINARPERLNSSSEFFNIK